MDSIVACQTCGLVQHVDPVPEGLVAKCARCNFQLFHRRRNSRNRTLAFSLAAAILYFPSNFYPLVTATYMGQNTATTIFAGISALFNKGQYFIASLVFCTSILTPALKILGLLFITITLNWEGGKKARTWIYKIIRVVDPWNMLEVFLLSILVSMAEMGEIATVHPGPGVFSFAAVVAFDLARHAQFRHAVVVGSAGGQKSL